VPLGDPLPGILESLRDAAPGTRVRAARRLADWDAVPPEAAPTLVLALEDEEGTEYEDWFDWAGANVGGELHRVTHYAAKALGQCGATGVELAIAAAVGGATGAGDMLPRVIVAASADVLLALGESERARALPFAPEAGDVRRTSKGEPLDVDARVAEAARALLLWAGEEERRDDPEWTRTAHRLMYPRYQVAVEAAKAMAGCPDKVWAAATLVDALLLEDLGYLTLDPAGQSLVALGPVLDERRLEALLEAARDNRPFGALGPVFRALAAHGRPAESLVPTLRLWLKAEPPRDTSKEYHGYLQAAARAALEALGEG
jgi:hypothetical protein